MNGERKILIPQIRDFEKLKVNAPSQGIQALCNLPCHQVCRACSCKAPQDKPTTPQNEYRFNFGA